MDFLEAMKGAENTYTAYRKSEPGREIRIVRVCCDDPKCSRERFIGVKDKGACFAPYNPTMSDIFATDWMLK